MSVTLPQQNENQRRGIQAADVVAIALSKIAFVNRIASEVDIGVDFICELRNHDQPTGKLFNVQCKVLPLKDENDPVRASINIKTKTARYWLQLPSPTLLLVADVVSGSIYWGTPVEQLIQRTDDWRSQESVTLEILKNTAFNCFEATPTAMQTYIQKGASHTSVALKERLHEITTCIVDEQQYGLRPIDQSVAGRLLSPQSALQDAFTISSEIQAFQDQFAQLIVRRTQKYANDLWGLCQKWYGKQLRKEGLEGNGLEHDFGGGVPINVIRNAYTALDALSTAPSPTAIQHVISALDDLEKLHANLFEYESVLYAEEKPLVDAILASIGQFRLQ
ncbi:DUF4365 domain-containing protein [Pseudomonas abietaniphila]